MPQAPLTVHIASAIEFVRPLDEAVANPVILISKGVRYQVRRQETPDDNLWAAYAPELP